MKKGERNHILTVLVEDYFQVGAFEKLIRQKNWSNFETRYERNTVKAIELLDKIGTKGTFFVLGWIAKRNPSLVKRIADAGHEIASRGYYHRTIQNLSPEEFRDDLRRTNDVLEDAAGRKVTGYRSAGKLRYDRHEWILEILVEEGFEYDASFMPRRGDSPLHRVAHKRSVGGRELWLFPYSAINLGFSLLPISGGNYLRQIPFTFMHHAILRWDRSTDSPYVFYFHVWELDPEQPRISAASRLNRVRHYRKLDKMEWIIEALAQDYRFTTIGNTIGSEEKLPDRSRVSRTPSAEIASERSLEMVHSQPNGPRVPVTIVVPCFNEEESLPYLVNLLPGFEQQFLARNYEPSFLFVDDGSSDRTLEKLENYFRNASKVRIVPHEANRGVAASIMTGIRSAQTEIVCSMDCDCTYEPYQLIDMVAKLTSGIDMVTASPYHKDGEVQNVPGWRLFLSRGASFLYRRLLHSKMYTYTSCFRVYRKSSVERIELSEDGFLGVAETLGRLDLAGGKIVEHPAILEVRLFGISKMKTARTIAGHLKLMSRLALDRFFREFRGY